MGVACSRGYGVWVRRVVEDMECGCGMYYGASTTLLHSYMCGGWHAWLGQGEDTITESNYTRQKVNFSGGGDHWTGPLDWTTGLDRTTGLNYWTGGLLDSFKNVVFFCLRADRGQGQQEAHVISHVFSVATIKSLSL